MVNFIWKILDVDFKDQIIKSAQYSVTATDENNSVETINK